MQVALREDHERLTAAFRESAARERELTREDWPGRVSALQEEVDRLRRELDAVLASPTWRAGRIVTALPRRVRAKRPS